MNKFFLGIFIVLCLVTAGTGQTWSLSGYINGPSLNSGTSYSQTMPFFKVAFSVNTYGGGDTVSGGYLAGSPGPGFYYIKHVLDSWSGTITPSRAGYTITSTTTPYGASRTIGFVHGPNQTQLNFLATDTMRPALYVKTPINGVTYYPGSVDTIRVTTLDNSTEIKGLYYSLSYDGSMWNTVGVDTSATYYVAYDTSAAICKHKMAFTVTQLADSAKLRVICLDLSKNADTVYVNISVRDSTKPTVTITSPTSSTKWEYGQSGIVSWTATDNIGVVARKISLSRDSGLTWASLDSAAGNTGTWTLTSVTDPPSTKCFVIVQVWDAAGNTAKDTSALFTIDHTTGVQPRLTMLTVKVQQPIKDYNLKGERVFSPFGIFVEQKGLLVIRRIIVR